MSATKEQLTAMKVYAEKFSASIISQQESKGLVASGRSLNHEIKENDDNIELIIAGYYQFLSKPGLLVEATGGRPPGGWPPPGIIADWIGAKNIPLGELSLNQLTFLIGRKIAERGTAIYNDNSLGIDMDEAANEGLAEMVGAIGLDSAVKTAQAIAAPFENQDFDVTLGKP